MSEGVRPEGIEEWVKGAQDSITEDVCWMLVGCKADLVSAVDDDALADVIQKYGFTHMRCSAKTGESPVPRPLTRRRR